MSAQTRAERMRVPLAIDVVTATAEQHGVCVRPFTMEVGDLDTGELRHVAVPCGSTVESQCGPCARKARALRITQCREGWHMAEEPDFTAGAAERGPQGAVDVAGRSGGRLPGRRRRRGGRAAGRDPLGG